MDLSGEAWWRSLVDNLADAAVVVIKTVQAGCAE